MNFKTKIAYTAVLATLGMVAGSAQAAYLSETGTGQVLIYPYYTVQGGTDTYISIVNTTTAGKAVKVRFLEAKASREVLDFNLYLSAKDVWAAAVTTSTDGAKLVTNDKSCTSPQITGAVAFRNGAYTGSQDDVFEDDLSRTREGYVEIIEMATLPTVIAPTGSAAGNLAWAIEHAKSGTGVGIPNDCPAVTAAWTNFGTSDTAVTTGYLGLNLGRPSGGLIGGATLINVAKGTDISYDPVVIDDFIDNTGSAVHYRPGSILPNFNDATPNSAVIRRNSAGAREIVTTNWGAGAGLNAISAVLTHASVMNEYTVETGINAGTDWVITFPTKWGHVPASGTTFTKPFTKAAKATATSTAWNACESVKLTDIFDREEKQPSGNIDFSPSPVTGTSLCFEANVITFNNTKVLGSEKVELNINSPYQNGWLDLTFNGGQSLVSPTNGTSFTSVSGTTTGTATYNGLPAVGFAAQKYVNGNVDGKLSNYGGSFIHKYTRNIAP